MYKKLIGGTIFGMIMTITFYLVLNIWSIFVSLAIISFAGSFLYFQAVSAMVFNLDEYIVQDPVTGFEKNYTPFDGILIVFVLFMIVFGIANTFIKNPYFSFPITYIITASIVFYISKYVGQEEEKHITRKKRQQDIFIDSLGTGEGRCQSCKTKLKEGQNTCPNCGFEN